MAKIGRIKTRELLSQEGIAESAQTLKQKERRDPENETLRGLVDKLKEAEHTVQILRNQVYAERLKRRK